MRVVCAPLPAVLPAARPLEAASVKRKRLKKMNRHKKRKLIKRERNKDRGK
jgi:predicted GIY-YIG superfamily endonuclease